MADRRRFGWTALAYAMLLVFAAATVLPFLYMVSLSLQTETEVFAGVPIFIPDAPRWRNYAEIWSLAPFARFLLNSLIVAGAITLSHLFFDPLAGYVFAKY
jgi:multiple sugar transport system permease protein